MGKKQKYKKGQLKRQPKNIKPFVSLCTPTFNRRPFIDAMIQCYMHQDYPRDKMEWIILDDGTDPIGDLVKDVPGVKYIRHETKLTIGKKRNMIHEASTGEILVYIDDDDYYPPTRVSHAVDMLTRSKRALCAGSSELHIWFNDTQEMIQFGPYSANHATAGTFAFKRELLKQTSYDETACLAEEKHFLKNYTIPFVQLNPKHTILVFSHDHNTFDKRTLLRKKDGKYVRDSHYTVDDFIKDASMKSFYMDNLRGTIKNYEPGKPKYKPDVLEQTKNLQEHRDNRKREQLKNSPITITDQSGTTRTLNNIEIRDMLRNYQAKIIETTSIIESLHNRCDSQKETIAIMQGQLTELQKKYETVVDERNLLKNKNVSNSNEEPNNSENITISFSESIKL